MGSGAKHSSRTWNTASGSPDPVNGHCHVPRRMLPRAGRLKKPSELTAEQGAALAGFEVLIKNAKASDGQIEEIHKIKLWDKMRALEALAKHFGLVRERLEVSGWDKLAAQLNHARTVGPTAST
jgi:hypothetical protein